MILKDFHAKIYSGLSHYVPIVLVKDWVKSIRPKGFEGSKEFQSSQKFPFSQAIIQLTAPL